MSMNDRIHECRQAMRHAGDFATWLAPSRALRHCRSWTAPLRGRAQGLRQQRQRVLIEQRGRDMQPDRPAFEILVADRVDRLLHPVEAFAHDRQQLFPCGC